MPVETPLKQNKIESYFVKTVLLIVFVIAMQGCDPMSVSLLTEDIKKAEPDTVNTILKDSKQSAGPSYAIPSGKGKEYNARIFTNESSPKNQDAEDGCCNGLNTPVSLLTEDIKKAGSDTVNAILKDNKKSAGPSKGKSEYNVKIFKDKSNPKNQDAENGCCNWLTANDVHRQNYQNGSVISMKAGLFFTQAILRSYRIYKVIHTYQNEVTVAPRATTSLDPGEFTLLSHDNNRNLLHQTSIAIGEAFFLNGQNGLIYRILINNGQGKGLLFPYGIAMVSKSKFNRSIGLAFAFGGLFTATQLDMRHYDMRLTHVSSEGYKSIIPSYGYFETVSSSDANIVSSTVTFGFSVIRNKVLIDGKIATPEQIQDFRLIKQNVISGIKLKKLVIDNFDFTPALRDMNLIIPIDKGINPSNYDSIAIKQYVLFSKTLLEEEKDSLHVVDFGSGVKMKLSQIKVKGALFGGEKTTNANGRTITDQIYLAGTYQIKTKELATKSLTPYWGIFLQKLDFSYSPAGIE